MKLYKIAFLYLAVLLSYSQASWGVEDIDIVYLPSQSEITLKKEIVIQPHEDTIHINHCRLVFEASEQLRRLTTSHRLILEEVDLEFEQSRDLWCDNDSYRISDPANTNYDSEKCEYKTKFIRHYTLTLKATKGSSSSNNQPLHMLCQSWDPLRVKHFRQTLDLKDMELKVSNDQIADF